MDINEFDHEVRSLLRTYNKLVKNNSVLDAPVYDYDKAIDSLSYVVKTVRLLERASKKIESKKKVSSKRWNLFVSYDLCTNFRDIQRKIESIVLVESTGSGAGLGMRDITYEFPNKKDAEKAKRKLKAKFRNNIQCELAPSG